MQASDFFRTRCVQLGISLTELSGRAGLTRMHLHRLMTGQVNDPGIRTLQRLALALRLPPISVYRLFTTEVSSNNEYSQRHANKWNSEDAVMFAGDITIPDYSVVLPGERFTKTWAIQNVGTTTWPERLLVRQDQELLVAKRMDMGQLVPVMDTHLASLGRALVVPPTPPAQVIELSMEFVAPRENCTVASIWRLEDEQGRAVYRDAFFLQVMVTVVGG